MNIIKKLIITMIVLCFIIAGLLAFLTMSITRMSSPSPILITKSIDEKIPETETYKLIGDSMPTAPIKTNFWGMYVDEVLEHLSNANIAFKTPDSMKKGEKREVQLLLSLTETSQQILDRMEILPTDNVGTENIKISERMSANLSGSGFKIVEVTPTEQVVSSKLTTEWRWEIYSLEKGNQSLYLSLNALIYLDGEKSPRSIKTFSKEIVVKYPLWDRIKDYSVPNIQWLWSAFVPVLLWFWSKFKKKKKKPVK